MKKKNKISKMLMLLVAMAAVMFSCVEDDYDAPHVIKLPVGDVYTIAQIKAIYADSAEYLNEQTEEAYLFNKDASIFATVTMDNETDNSYRTFYIQDATGAIAIYQDVSGGVYIGDSVQIYLKDLVIMQYSNLYQINTIDGDGVNVDDNVQKHEKTSSYEVVPEIATISEINSNKSYYQGRLVKITDVQFSATDTAKTYANAADLETENRNLEDNAGNKIIVRTSGYANFADVSVADGNGSIIAIVGQYNEDMQLYIRKISEVDMDGERFGGGGGTGEGAGTFDDPYNVANAIINSSETDVWVEGYLVGVYETKDASGNDLTDFAPSFTAPFNTTTNVIIADSETETNISNCLVIKLPTGEIRDVTNLSENGSNLGKVVKYKGDRDPYFGENGLENVNGYWLDGSGIVPATGFFEESFSSSLGDFTTYSVTGSQVWEYSSSFSCAVMTGYDDGAYTNDDWLISPAMDLTSRTNVKLNFVHAIGYGNYAGIEDELSVFVSSDYSGSGDPGSATWTELTFDMPADLNDYFVWTNSGDIDLSAYDGLNNVYFAFNYTCGSSSVSTWEIKDVVVSEGVK